MDVGIVEHDLTPPAQPGARIRLALGEDVDHAAAEIGGAGAFGQAQTGGLDRRIDRVLVEGVAHDGVADPVAPTRRTVAEHDDLGTVELDAAGAGGHGAEDGQVVADHAIADPALLDLAQADRDAEGGGSIGEVHRAVRVGEGGGLATFARLPDPVHRQQRGLGLDPVHVGGIGDAGVHHRLADRGRHLVDHGATPDLLGEDGRGEGGADGQPGRGIAGAAEDRRVGAEDSVGPPRPDHRDRPHLRGVAAAMAEEDLAVGAVGKDPGEVVDAAVPLRLADHGDDGVGIDHARHHQILQGSGIAGSAAELNLVDGDRHPAQVSGWGFDGACLATTTRGR